MEAHIRVLASELERASNWITDAETLTDAYIVYERLHAGTWDNWDLRAAVGILCRIATGAGLASPARWTDLGNN